MKAKVESGGTRQEPGGTRQEPGRNQAGTRLSFAHHQKTCNEKTISYTQYTTKAAHTRTNAVVIKTNEN